MKMLSIAVILLSLLAVNLHYLSNKHNQCTCNHQQEVKTTPGNLLTESKYIKIMED